MNNQKTLLPLAIAFGLGGLLGYIITKKLLAEKYEEDMQIEVKNIRSYYRNKYEDNSKILNRNITKPDLRTLVTPYTTSIDDIDTVDSKYFKTDEEEAQAEMDEDLTLAEQEEANEDLQNETDQNGEPFLINYAEFCKPNDVYDKVDLYYYRADDILCDGKDIIIHDPEDILGWDWLNEMQKQTTIFVRNPKLAIDYEIHTLGLSFSDEVTSRLETDKERKYRRIARQKKAMDDIATEHMEDRYEDGDYVIKRPVKAKSKAKTGAVHHSNNYINYSKVKSIEDAEEIDESE